MAIRSGILPQRDIISSTVSSFSGIVEIPPKIQRHANPIYKITISHYFHEFVTCKFFWQKEISLKFEIYFFH